MKYVARDLGASAENSSGGGGRGLARELLTLALLTVCVLSLLYFLAGLVTDFAVARISPAREAALFEGHFVDEFAEEVPEAYAQQWRKAEAILAKVQQATGVPPLHYQLGYQSSTQPNAFALPGGHIILTQGLLDALDAEIALAFVLAHELGHFAGRDHLQRLGRQLGFGAGLMLLTGFQSNALFDTVSNFLALNYSREEERAADRFALQVLDQVYGSRDGAERLFEILEQEEQLPGWAYMFQTHPDTAERIREIHEVR
ncbi:M48 family metallopeptidase [Coraliomargarita sp. SDUM461003]|uniref:M48 family metallopeptidase n=1 Tax=Thalassobacterium maritimum TaxID=3041265 RepID=A0ABU1AZ50_9BACT|nr:M48 family metallopeptidase [Coraliomargarita sp. SDUM461003]MDQ8209426.1 M48 family metallopeptidase [Coraliomargarita sp. SDUM461003]